MYYKMDTWGGPWEQSLLFLIKSSVYHKVRQISAQPICGFKSWKKKINLGKNHLTFPFVSSFAESG